jgi:hypothetical protein
MKLDYHGDSGIVEPRGNVRIQTIKPLPKAFWVL